MQGGRVAWFAVQGLPACLASLLSSFTSGDASPKRKAFVLAPVLHLATLESLDEKLFVSSLHKLYYAVFHDLRVPLHTNKRQSGARGRLTIHPQKRSSKHTLSTLSLFTQYKHRPHRPRRNILLIYVKLSSVRLCLRITRMGWEGKEEVQAACPHAFARTHCLDRPNINVSPASRTHTG